MAKKGGEGPRSASTSAPPTPASACGSTTAWRSSPMTRATRPRRRTWASPTPSGPSATPPRTRSRWCSNGFVVPSSVVVVVVLQWRSYWRLRRRVAAAVHYDLLPLPSSSRSSPTTPHPPLGFLRSCYVFVARTSHS